MKRSLIGLSKVVDRIRIPIAVARAMGPAWTCQRLRGLVEHKFGALERRLPNADWEEFDLDVNPDEFRRRQIWPIDIKAARRMALIFPDPDLKQRVQDLLGGKLSIFGGAQREVGWPPNWHLNADDNRKLVADQHFSRLSTFAHGDIKNFWEPARFGFVWLLCRAHFAGIMDNADQLFFNAINDFVEKNPPYRGPQWMCGQEAAIRAVTIAGGWSVFCESASNEDISNLIRLFSATGNRIAAHLDYALSQKNNHGLSEAMGLLVIGLNLPEHPKSSVWVQAGRRILEREASELVDADGGFSQQSANYHRVMIHDLVAAVSIAQQRDMELPECRAALKRSSGFLDSMIVRDGHQPRYGHDDGACVLDWTSCDYDDFRPALQEASYVSRGKLPISPGPWDAGLPWLGCSSPELTPREQHARMARVVHRHAGMAVLRGPDACGNEQYTSLRIPPGRFRPGQVDALHVDVWLNGFNVAIDPGTYRYNAEGDWSKIPLALSRSHNMVGSDGQELVRRVGRFLYVPWPRVFVDELDSVVESHEIAVGGRWGHLIGGITTWGRRVEVGLRGVEIYDHITCRDHCSIELRWHLADGDVISDATIEKMPCNSVFQWRLPIGVVELAIEVDTPQADIAMRHDRAGETFSGWYAPRYGELSPCHRVVTEIRSGLARKLTITSRFRLITPAQKSNI